MLEDWHASYRQETGDAELPVFWFIDWLYEAIAEQRREKGLGRGVVLSTLHGAKGLEFGHVFILDGDWRRTAEVRKQEEERRLLYVGMTRAKETLCLVEMEKSGNPFLAGLEGDGVLKRRMPLLDPGGRKIFRRYCMLSLADIYLGYAGRFAQGHAIHRRLAALSAGDSLSPAAVGEGVELQTGDGFCVAKLSANGGRQWCGRLKEIAEARIVGMIQWSADSTREEFRSHLKVDAWEVPLLELALEGAAG
jgi:ATP-dependent DNA helicase RecQ